MEQKDLIEKLISGDQRAFNFLVDENRDRIYNTCLGMLQNEVDAEDICQEVFIMVFQSIENFKQDSTLQTWLYRIATNKCIDFIRKQRTQKRFAFVTSLFGNDRIEARRKSDFVHPGIALEQKENAAMLFKAIEKLPDNQKAAFTLHKVEGLSYKEVANILGLSLSSIESLMFRAQSNLRKELEGYYKKHLKD